MSAETQSGSPVPTDTTHATQINQLHRLVMKNCTRCETKVYEALLAAWEAGQLLCEKKIAVRRKMGHGAWVPWLIKHFSGSPRTAQRYMLLAKSVTDVSQINGLSLRQAYMRLGLRVEEKGCQPKVIAPPLPSAARSVNRLLRMIPSPTEYASLPTDRQELLRRDLRQVWERLKNIFREGPPCSVDHGR